MRFLRSFAILQVTETCDSCSHPWCAATRHHDAPMRRYARELKCADCLEPIGLDRAFLQRDCAAHLECLAAVLCQLFAGGGFVRDSSRVGPASRVEREVAA